MAPPPASEQITSNNQQQQRQAQFSQQRNDPAVGISSTGSQQQYSIPGILHFLQFEWQRFELERQQWNVERAELQARIALLQGERKGQENLKNDLIRRIKMLEFCLQQERARFHREHYGVDAPNTNQDETLNDEALNDDPLVNNNNGDQDNSGVNWKSGRQMLRQYLQEIGYTDTIIDVRSNRVRSLLGLNNSISASADGSVNHAPDSSKNQQQQQQSQQTQQQQQQQQQQPVDSTQNQTARGSPVYGRRNLAPMNTSDRHAMERQTASILADTEVSVLATFEFLNEHRKSNSNREDDADEDEDDDELVEAVTGRTGGYMDSETEEVMSEFDFLSTAHQANSDGKNSSVSGAGGAGGGGGAAGGGGGSWRAGIPDLGELANLTLTNETEINGSTVQNSVNNEFRKTWNPKYTLKSHFDCIRSLVFHATEPVLVTCSDDETLKLWNLNKTQTQTNKGKQQQQQQQPTTAASSGATFDLEAVYTFRGHKRCVLSLTMQDNLLYSGAQNGELFIWKLPENIPTMDPYDPYNDTLAPVSLDGHTDAIWSLVTLEGGNRLCSAAADGTLKVWDINRREPIKSLDVRATCVASVSPSNNNTCGPGNLLVVSYTDGSLCLLDVNTGNKPLLNFENDKTSLINSVVVHPTMPVVVSAHEDRQIKFWDLNNGKCLNAMVAHLDEVTCLACDPNGLYLLSGSHDCSVRLWNFENRTCVQEITSHRKKFDEAIFDVAFHPSKPFFASAGADALAKVFV